MPPKKTQPEARTEEYVHAQATRPNNPEAGLHSADKVKVPPRVKYQYDPHLDPQLVWASKAERSEIEVETVSLHKHEIVRPQDILSMVQGEAAQGSLFGDPRLPIHKAVEFYRHDQTWMNRMVLGDSLLVMNSLLHKENLGGKVQMIYIDPPYGIAYNSNFQPRIDKREVHDGKDDSLSREPEQIKAYRDTWTLGIHSYLSYLRDRLLLARDLLTESGSVFVQISNENVHHVRELLDEVFGSENHCATIVWKKASPDASVIRNAFNYILWYARCLPRVKSRKLFKERTGAEGSTEDPKKLALWGEFPGGTTRPLTADEKRSVALMHEKCRVFRVDKIVDRVVDKERQFSINIEGKPVSPGASFSWRGTPEEMERLIGAGRVVKTPEGLGYKFYVDDYPVVETTNLWEDTAGKIPDMNYVVQTNEKIIRRCMLMNTDPGDLVLDPTCGSGTTAFVAEQWGRRWITCDTSRVALSLARQRLMTAAFPYYELAYPKEGVAGGFKYKEVPHVTLKSIAQNLAPETEKLYDQPVEKKHITRVAGPFSVEAIAALDPSEAMTPAPSVTQAVPAKSADRVQQLFDVLAKDGGLNVPGRGRIEIHGLRRVMDVDGLDAEGEIKVDRPQRLAVAFGPYHGPVTANRLEDAITVAKAEGYDALAMAGFSFDPEVSAFLDKHVNLGIQLFRVQIAPDVQIGDLLKVKHAEKLFSVLGQPDFVVEKSGVKLTVTLKGVDLYDPNTRLVKAHQLDDVAAWFLDTDYDGRCFRVRQVFLPAQGGKGFEKLQKALKAIVDEDAWEGLKGFTSLPFEPGALKTVAVKVIDVYGHEVVGVRRVKG